MNYHMNIDTIMSLVLSDRNYTNSDKISGSLQIRRILKTHLQDNTRRKHKRQILWTSNQNPLIKSNNGRKNVLLVTKYFAQFGFMSLMNKE